MAACSGEAPVGPSAGGATAPRLTRAADPVVCGNQSAPAGTRLAYHAYGRGVQIYRWDGTGWLFVAPAAVLFASARSRGVVGTHYAGPTWRSVSGSTVVGTVVNGCSPNAGAIPWLLLRTVTATGPGVLARTTFIQRVNTVGGMAPSRAGTAAGEEARVPYAADYNFYRAR